MVTVARTERRGNFKSNFGLRFRFSNCGQFSFEGFRWSHRTEKGTL